MGNDAERYSVPAEGLSPEGRDYWIYDEMLPTKEDEVDEHGGLIPIPNFGVKELAKVFFGMSPDWLRWRNRPAKGHPDGFFVLDGELIEPRRTEHGARVYTLADAERMAHALTLNGVWPLEKLVKTIMVIKWVARLYDVDIDNERQ